jgi:hypothetical protein
VYAFTILRRLIMKKAFKIIGIAVMLAAIAFSMAACEDGSGPGGSGGGGGGGGSNPGGGSGGGSNPGGGTSGSGGTLTLTRFSSKHEGKYAKFYGQGLNIGGDTNYIEGWGIKSGVLTNVGGIGSGNTKAYLISNGKVNIPVVKEFTSFKVPEPYNGNETCEVNIEICVVPNSPIGSDLLAIAGPKNIKFSNGSAALSWSDDFIIWKADTF